MKAKMFEQLNDILDEPFWVYTAIDGGYTVHKFINDNGEIKPASSYFVNKNQCTCPSFDSLDYEGCKHLEMMQNRFKDVGCSGNEAREHLTKFTERFIGDQFELPFIPDRVGSILLDIVAEGAFEKSYKKGLRLIAGKRKLSTGNLGIVLKFKGT